MLGLVNFLLVMIINKSLILLLLFVNKMQLVQCFKSTVSNPNIVIIFVDDLRHLDNKNVNLPNIRKMAAKGISFTNSIAQQALCAPSRNSMLTGRRPDSIRLYDFYSYWRDDVGNFTTLPQLFKENGYNTISVGKIFHPGASSNYTDDYPYSWSLLPYHPPSEIFKDSAVCRDNITKQLHRNLICPVRLNEQPDKTLPDLQTLAYAIKIIKENRNQPFLLAVGFHKPHIPLKFPNHYLNRIPVENVKPPNYPYKPKNMPLVAWHPWRDVRKRDDIRRLNISYPMGIMPQKWTLKIRQNYYAATAYIDDLIGTLIRYVNKSNTVVVLTSDHGWSLGENGLWAKYSNFDVAVNVPLIFNVPGVSPKVITTPVELIDIFPTLTEIAGIKGIPKCRNNEDKTKTCFDGKSLVPLMEGGKHETIAISQYPRPSVHPRRNSDKPRLKDIKIMGYSIRTKRYRYTEWVSFNNTLFRRDWNKVFGIELYDHLINPDESKNLYLEPTYQHVKNKLSKLLKEHIESK